MGKFKYDNYGDVFLSAILDFCSNTTSTILDKKEKQEKEDTKMVTYGLYQEGKTIEEIALSRELTKQTIENHLLNCYEANLEINLENLVHTDNEKIICHAITSNETGKLKDIKESLPSGVTYFDIKYYFLKMHK